MGSCVFKIVRDEPGKALVIRDTGEGTDLTVTNDAQNVVRALIPLLEGNRRLFYFDSDGQLDEIVHVNGTFRCFAPGPRSGKIEDVR